MPKQLFGIALLLILFCIAPSAAAAAPTEYQVKAAYLYNFAKFITWPDAAFKDPKAPFVIGVLGQNSFVDALEPLTQKRLRNRPIVVKHFNTIGEATHCHILYLSTAQDKDLENQLNSLADHPVVSVGEGKRFASWGGMIQLTPLRGRLRFAINLGLADRVGIKIDAQLLSLAAEVLEVKQ